jgi:hypothetical protein
MKHKKTSSLKLIWNLIREFQCTQARKGWILMKKRIDGFLKRKVDYLEEKSWRLF